MARAAAGLSAKTRGEESERCVLVVTDLLTIPVARCAIAQGSTLTVPRTAPERLKLRAAFFPGVGKAIVRLSDLYRHARPQRDPNHRQITGN
jgi:hypothetical protein